MNQHTCFICLGSNFNREAHMKAARNALNSIFTDIRFGTEMVTEAIGNKFLSPFSNQVAKFSTALHSEEIRAILKQIEHDNGRLPEDKEHGIVKMDIDLLKYDNTILKPNDLKKDFVQAGLSKLLE